MEKIKIIACIHRLADELERRDDIEYDQLFSSDAATILEDCDLALRRIMKTQGSDDDFRYTILNDVLKVLESFGTELKPGRTKVSDCSKSLSDLVVILNELNNMANYRQLPDPDLKISIITSEIVTKLRKRAEAIEATNNITLSLTP